MLPLSLSFYVFLRLSVPQFLYLSVTPFIWLCPTLNLFVWVFFSSCLCFSGTLLPPARGNRISADSDILYIIKLLNIIHRESRTFERVSSSWKLEINGNLSVSLFLLSVCLSVSLCVSLFFCQSVSLFFYQSVGLFLCQCFFCQSVFLLVWGCGGLLVRTSDSGSE